MLTKIEVLNKERIFTYWRSYKIKVNDRMIEGKRKTGEGETSVEKVSDKSNRED